MLYRVYLLLHLMGVILFFGGFVAALLAKAFADRAHDPRIAAHTFRMINFNDKWFTPLSVVLILVGGFGTAGIAGLPVVETGWIFWSLVLFGVSGLIFVFRALPLQHRLERTAQTGVEANDFDWARYQRQARTWSRWAYLAFFAVLVALVLMVLQPALPTP